MRPSLRFLGVAVVGWAGLRAATLGRPARARRSSGSSASEAKAPPIVPTEFPPIEPVAPRRSRRGSRRPRDAADMRDARHASAPTRGSGLLRRAAGAGTAPVDRRALHARPARAASAILSPRSRRSTNGRCRASLARRCRARARAWPLPGAKQRRSRFAGRLDRIQLTVLGDASSASRARFGPTLAGQRRDARRKPGRRAPDLQFHARRSRRRLRTTLRRRPARRRGRGRHAHPAGRRHPRVAHRRAPPAARPLWRRSQRLRLVRSRAASTTGRCRGSSASTPISRAGWSACTPATGSSTAGFTLTRPVYKQFSAGLGVWGGAQPGVYRVDAGPRITHARAQQRASVHLDWRQRLAGNAAPGSGPAVTLAGDF